MQGDQETIPVREHEFALRVYDSISALRLEMRESSATLTGKMVAVVDHLAQLNGSVAKHAGRLNVLEQHPQTCPLVNRVSALEAAKTAILTAEAAEERHQKETEQAVEKTKASYMVWLRPLILLGIVFFLGLVLGHSDLMQSLLGKFKP